jgi:hypothetical protein
MSEIIIRLDTAHAETLIGFLGEFLDGEFAEEECFINLYNKLVREMNY